jgi:hypothetical protein
MGSPACPPASQPGGQPASQPPAASRQPASPPACLHVCLAARPSACPSACPLRRPPKLIGQLPAREAASSLACGRLDSARPGSALLGGGGCSRARLARWRRSGDSSGQRARAGLLEAARSLPVSLPVHLGLLHRHRRHHHHHHHLHLHHHHHHHHHRHRHRGGKASGLPPHPFARLRLDSAGVTQSPAHTLARAAWEGGGVCAVGVPLMRACARLPLCVVCALPLLATAAARACLRLAPPERAAAAAAAAAYLLGKPSCSARRMPSGAFASAASQIR